MLRAITICLLLAINMLSGCVSSISARQSEELVAIHHDGAFAWYGIHMVTMQGLLPVPFVQTATKLCPTEMVPPGIDQLHIPVIKLSPSNSKVITQPWKGMSEYISESQQSNDIFWVISTKPTIIAGSSDLDPANNYRKNLFRSHYYPRWLLHEHQIDVHFVLRDNMSIKIHSLHFIDQFDNPLIVECDTTIGELLESDDLRSHFD